MRFIRKIFISGAVLLVSLLSGCNLNYFDYSQHIESFDGQYNFSLYTDNVGIGDPGYYVLKLEKEIDPHKLYINWNSSSGISSKDSDWIESRQVLFNYDEAGFFTANPKIELMESRFLVFSRGGYYMGLYDTKFEKDTLSVVSPWNTWYSSRSHYGKYDKDIDEKGYENWIKHNLHNPIKLYIKNNK